MKPDFNEIQKDCPWFEKSETGTVGPFCKALQKEGYSRTPCSETNCAPFYIVNKLLGNPTIIMNPPEPDCEHNYTPRQTCVICSKCGEVHTGSSWGIAKNKTFKSLSEAEFYRIHGRLPE